jgi:hypothetical protein
MKTILQELIQWTIENAFTVEAQDGTHYVAIDHEEMRAKFDDWLEKEKQQLIDFHIEVMKLGLINEGGEKWKGGYEPIIRNTATEYYDKAYLNNQTP